MLAAVRTRYGGPQVVQVQEVDAPAPGDDEVLVRVRASSVNAGDVFLLHGRPFVIRLAGFGVLRPKIQILGGDIAGVVERVGKNVKRLKPGDEVFGDVNFHRWGGFAQYACTTESSLVIKPAGVGFEDAAAVPMAGMTAMQALKTVAVKAGERVLVNGASGGVGTHAVQIAKALGAEVMAVCSTANVEQAHAIGADHVIDYTQEDFRRQAAHYDVIVDVATKQSIRTALPCLRDGGRYVVAGGGIRCVLEAFALGRWLGRRRGLTITTVMHHSSNEDMQTLADLLGRGALRPAVDRVHPLHELPQAMRYVGEGHARGKVVITIP